MLQAAVLIPLLPLLGAALVGVLGSRVLKGRSHWPVILGIAGAALASFIVLGVMITAPSSFPAATGTHRTGATSLSELHDTTYKVFSWIPPQPGLSFDVNFRIDPLTAIMLTMIGTVATLIAVYSRDYMRHHDHPERGYERFFAFIGLFVFSMATLVLAGNFLLLYLGWELVGLCSYLLIGFYYPRPSAAAAAKKAFLVNRIGDFGFGLGILFIYLWISPLASPGQSPLDYAVVFQNVTLLAPWQCNTIALLLFCGAVGKSAQIPLYVWLPDAMEGPSPVSALIHAATMVTAGVYMVVRCGAIFANAPIALPIVAAVGAITALFAATIALAQYDMKRILAYSTMSQLGYMFLGAGVLAADSAIFHLFTHAFFKALLFLGAGSVMHAMGGVIDVREFGGLRKVLPWTFRTFVIGSLALAGFPFLSGFFSKDEIIHAAFNYHPLLGFIGLLTAVLTAFYTFRMVFLAFNGPQRVPDGVHPHEAPAWMLVPLVALAIGAIGTGYLGVRVGHGGFLGVVEPHGAFHRFLAPVIEPYTAALSHQAAHTGEGAAHGEEGHLLMYVSALLALLGIAAAYYLYVLRRDLAERIRTGAYGLYTVLHHKYYVDEAYDAAVVQPLRTAGVTFFNLDRFLIDGILWLITAVPRSIGFVLRGLQNGVLQSYGVTMTAGLVLVVVIAWLSQ